MGSTENTRKIGNILNMGEIRTNFEFIEIEKLPSQWEIVSSTIKSSLLCQESYKLLLERSFSSHVFTYL